MKHGQKGNFRIKPIPVVNAEIGRLCQELEKLDRVPFGPSLSQLGSSELCDAVVCHRILSKFMEPVPAVEKMLHDSCVTAMVEHDSRGFSFNPTTAGADVRPILYRAKIALHDFFRGFKPSYRFRPPTGESAKSNHGLTDVMHKLSDPEHWEVSRDALPYAVAICYNNLWLKRVVKAHFHNLEPTGLEARAQKDIWAKEARESDRKIGYYVFTKMFMSLCRLNAVVRVTSIPKNSKARRVISMVPFWNMVCQLSLMSDIRGHLRRKMGIDLRHLQEIHKTLIRHRKFATIDLSRASDSVWQDVVDFLFPGSIRRWTKSLVDKHYEYTIDGETHYGYFNMFSPMGCGLTFDIMTLMLLFLGRQFDSATSVFGDDIILRAENAPMMYRVLEEIGMTVNESKSFTEGSFSESCGGYYDHVGKRDIVSFDFEWATTRVEAYALVNKLGLILKAGQVTPSLHGLLGRVHRRIVRALRSFAFAGECNELRADGIIDPYGYSSPRTSAVTRLLQTYWHRPVRCYTSATIVRPTLEIKESQAVYASFFLRGESYRPPSGESKTVYNTADCWTGTALAGTPLLTFLR